MGVNKKIPGKREVTRGNAQFEKPLTVKIVKIRPSLMRFGMLKFIDLFAGIGGIRKGFELAANKRGIDTRCVFTSEIKPYAVDILKQNHPGETVHGDITKIQASEIPDFDVLLAGFPCQAFSSAGRRLGFEDTRGTLFFFFARILKEKKPKGFVLENVEGLVKHDLQNPKDSIGKTLSIILKTLEEIGYKVSWKVLNSKNFGVAQDRKRIYIVGSLKDAPELENFPIIQKPLGEFLESGKGTKNGKLASLLLSHFDVKDLYGKAIKDKRGGDGNIHSWDIELKGKTTKSQRDLLNTLLKERRKKHWAEKIGIDWMDGMPLTYEQIQTFFNSSTLKSDLKYLTEKGYLSFEHPKKKCGRIRQPDDTLPKGYNIVSGKLSFEIAKILDPKGIAPTLVAMDMNKLHVIDGEFIRPLTLREGLRLFGYPEDFAFNISIKDGFDLLGNTVVVPVIQAVSSRLLDVIGD